MRPARRLPPVLACALAAAAAGCAPARPAARGARHLDEVSASGSRFRVEYVDEDAAAARQVMDALRAAAPDAARFGALAEPVLIVLHPSHQALEAAVHREGYAWLRAWARYRQIDLQSPRTWPAAPSGAPGPPGRELRELLVHELTHCAMYQLAADERTWIARDIPRWFSEGLASVAAGQGRLRGSLGELARTYPSDADPLLDPEPLYRDRSELVYRAAHHAVAYLVAREGEARVRRVLEAMGEGRTFREAFAEVMGEDEATFAAAFRWHVLGARTAVEARPAAPPARAGGAGP